MAVEEQSGGSSLLYWGLQSGNETPITAGAESNPAQAYVKAADTGTGKIIKARFPFTSLGVDMGGEQAESASIIGRNSASKPAPGQIWGEGPAEFEVIPRNMIHILRPSFGVKPTVDNGVDAAIRNATDNVRRTSVTLGNITAGNKIEAGNTHYKRGLSGSTEDDEDKAGIRFAKPCRIRFELSTSVAEGDTVKVVGEKRYGLPDEEVVAFVGTYKVSSDDKMNNYIITTDYFDSWKTAEVVGGVTGKTVAIDNSKTPYKTGVYTTTLPGFATDLGNGITIFGRKGNMPFLSQNAQFNNITITVGDDLRVAVEVLAGTYFNRRLPETGREEKLKIPSGEGSWQDDDNYPIGKLDFAPAWGSLFKYGEDTVDLTGLTLNINLNLELSRAYRASRQRGRPRRSTTPRQITITPTTFFEYDTEANDTFLKWQDLYLANETAKCTFSSYNWDDEGKEHEIVFTLPACVPNAVVPTVVDGSGDIERPVSLLSVPNSSDPSNELSVTFITDQYKV